MRADVLRKEGCTCPLIQLDFSEPRWRGILPCCFVSQHLRLLIEADRAEVLPAYIACLLLSEETRH